MTALLDANVFIVLVVAERVHHDAAADWLAVSDAGFATCPVTQGSLVRFLMRAGQSAAAARDVISAVERSDRHEFWSASVSFAEVEIGGVVGHRQVTDAYLAQLARSRHGRLATFDSGLAHLHSDVAVLIPSTDPAAALLNALAELPTLSDDVLERFDEAQNAEARPEDQWRFG